MKATNPIPDAALLQHLIVLGKTGAGKSSAMRVLVERLLDLGKPVCIIDPKGDWWGLKSSADGRRAGYPVVIFGGEHADVPLNAHAGAHVAELIATGNRPALIDLGGWMVGERTRFFIDFASTLFRHSRGPRHLVIDEVHNFAPQGKILDPDAGKMLHWANRLASEGRGKGITLIAASQRPQKVHKDFLTSAETLVAMRVVHPLDRGAIKEWVDGCPDPVKGKEVLGSLASMPRGEGWVWSPEIGFGPERVRFPLFSTYDSFKAPTGEQTAKLKGWAEVDLEEIRAKLSAVVEEAQANDPATLKREIARLRAEISKANGAGRPTAEDLQAADQRGYTRGWNEAMAQAEASRKELCKVVQRAVADAFNPPSRVEMVRPELRLDELPQLPGLPTPKRPRNIPDSIPVTGNGGNSGNGKLSKAERLVLTALAQYPQGRTRTQVAILTGYSSTGGGFNNALSSLRSKGWMTGSNERLAATPAGLEALGPFDPLPHGEALLQHWFRQLSKAERAILQVLVEAYPVSMPKAEVAQLAGYEPNGGGFNNALSRLRTLELISGRGELEASPDLFG